MFTYLVIIISYRYSISFYSRPNENFALRIKLSRLLFDFGVVNTTDDDCEQHVRASQSVYNSWQHNDSRTRFTSDAAWRQLEQKAVL